MKNLKVVTFLEFGVKAFSAVVARLLGGAHAAAAVLLWAAGRRLTQLQEDSPTLSNGGWAFHPSKQRAHRKGWCARHPCVVLGAHAGWPAGLGQHRPPAGGRQQWRRQVDQDSSPEVGEPAGSEDPLALRFPGLTFRWRLRRTSHWGRLPQEKMGC